ncbi:hypothetical protein L7F22_006781 [Adiantum nelumboides]|nr:hypothetical protein [Adiantum nelumboides]
MGCATLNDTGHKHAEREHSYAALSRNVSTPIHHLAETEDDGYHVVSLASSSHGIYGDGGPGDPINKDSFVRTLQDKHIILEEKRRSVDLGMHKSVPKHRIKLKPVQEVQKWRRKMVPQHFSIRIYKSSL